MARLHTRSWLLGLLTLLVALSVGQPALAGGGEKKEYHLIMRDSMFVPGTVKVPVGTTVIWHDEGRNPHTVTADDGSFNSGHLSRGQTFRVTFDKPGRYAYHCIPHGGAGGKGMSGVILVGDVADDATTALFTPKERRPEGPKTLRVPGDFPAIQAAVDDAHPGDLILIAPGVYHESVMVMTPDLTIRGLDRNQVILDGDFEKDNGVKVLGASGVVVENLTARHFTLNGFYWTGVKGWRGSYLTAYNNGDYGVYAFDSVGGQMDHSYASGNPDSGFYIGQCKPCDAIITDVIAENNGLGYSGTNAGGNLTIMNSIWRHNWSGLVPNTLDTEQLAPQVGTRIVNNVIADNNNSAAPGKPLVPPSLGIGVVIAGGSGNIVEGNLITGHQNYGVLVAPNIDVRFWLAHGNVVRQNTIRGSGRGDLGLAAPAGSGNVFVGNDHTTSMPAGIEALYAPGAPLSRLGGGEPHITLTTFARVLKAEATPKGDWKTMPVPLPQPTMPDPMARPQPAWPTPDVARIPGNVTPPGAPADSTPSRSLALLSVGPWWVMAFGLYAYLLPFVLYATWMAVAVWDLFRREDRGLGFKLAWLAVVLLVPFVGAAGYHLLGGSPVARTLRWSLVLGGLAAYLAVAGLGIVIA